MSEIDEEQIRKWGLVYSDLISTKLKLNITFKNFSGEEIIYNEFITKNGESKWITLCEEKTNNQTFIVTIDYISILGCTNKFFTDSTLLDKTVPKMLSFSEKFIANELSSEILPAFSSNELDIEFIRNEEELRLVHPFHEDESITVYKYEWTIDNQPFGVLNLCHSHVL